MVEGIICSVRRRLVECSSIEWMLGYLPSTPDGIPVFCFLYRDVDEIRRTVRPGEASSLSACCDTTCCHLLDF